MSYDVLRQVRFRDWNFHVSSTARRDYLQVAFMAPDVGMSHIEAQYGRKWLLQPDMTDGEIVQTALKAILCAMEHEVREEFTYKGEAIFGPHYDIESLVDLCKLGKIITRVPARSA